MLNIKQIIKKLDAAEDAIDKLQDELSRRGIKGRSLYKLKSDLVELSDYLEKQTWSAGEEA